MIGTILLFIIILGLLVFSHELGHFLSAKKMGAGVEEFGFGFPPRFIGFQRFTSSGIDQTKKIKKWRIFLGQNKSKHPANLTGGTIYSLNWIPIGGFVKIKGEQGDNKQAPDSFGHKKIWQRTIILSSGVIMNFILAFAIISLGFMIGLPSAINDSLPATAHVKNQAIQIAEIQKDSPADKAGLKMGDYIVSVDGRAFTKVAQFQEYTRPQLNKTIKITVKRANESITQPLTPIDLNNNGQGVIGTWLVDTGNVSFPWYYSFWMGLKTTGAITWQIIVAFFQLLKNLIINQKISADIAGPVGIATITGQVAKLGFIYILQFTALLSINLAIINFLPFPALDGGRVLFLAIEKIRGKPVNQKIENMIHNIGFALLMGLVLLVTFRDITRLGGGFKNIINNIF